MTAERAGRAEGRSGGDVSGPGPGDEVDRDGATATGTGVRRRRPAQAGVSLVEVLVVLVLIGVMAGAIGLSLGGAGQAATADREARVLAARLTRAADEALLSGEAMAVTWTDAGYRLLRLHDGDWVAYDVPQLAATHDLPRGLRLVRSGPVAAAGSGLSLTPDDPLSDPDALYVVGADLLPETGAPLTLDLRDDDGGSVRVTFDGATARLEDPA